ncbi:hypothetical protein [Haloarcula sp. H-GB5]
MTPNDISYGDSVVVERFGDDIVVNKHDVSTIIFSSSRLLEAELPLTTADLDYNPWIISRYWVDTPQHHYVFSNSWTGAKRQALCWAAIMQKTGLRTMESDSNVVPIEVATLGKPYIAAYLYAVHEFEIDEIAEKLDLTEQSVSQYLTDVGKSRR